MAHPRLIEDQSGMIFEYLEQEEAEFLYEVSSAIIPAVVARHTRWGGLGSEHVILTTAVPSAEFYLRSAAVVVALHRSAYVPGVHVKACVRTRRQNGLGLNIDTIRI